MPSRVIRRSATVTVMLKDSGGTLGVATASGSTQGTISGPVTDKSGGTIAVASGSLVAVAIAASLVPVRRAVSVDPLTALRAQ